MAPDAGAWLVGVFKAGVVDVRDDDEADADALADKDESPSAGPSPHASEDVRGCNCTHAVLLGIFL